MNVLAIVAFLMFPLSESQFASHKDYGLNATQIIRKYGYKHEEHTNIETADGYLLQMYRISPSTRVINESNAPVLLVHGLMASCECWLLKSESSLPFILSNHGYDVWLANTRGSKHSRNHVRHNANASNDPFWKYSFHEIGYYDLPALIDRVLNVTLRNSLTYIGHSQGSTALFVLLSMRTQYNEKIRLGVAFAPIAFMGHIKQPVIKSISSYHLLIQRLVQRMQIYEVFPQREFMWNVNGALCSEQTVLAAVCNALMFLVIGTDWMENRMSTMSLISNHFPDDISIYQLLHYLQLVNSGRFAMFDYGRKRNLRIYNSTQPPAYKLDEVRADIALFYAQNDLLASELDVQMLKSKIRSVYDYIIPHKYFNHFDFLVAINTNELVYNPLLNVLSNHK